VGSAVAIHGGQFVWYLAGLALVVAVAMQIGVNYANDYSDGVRGTDANRVGPARLVAGGRATPAEVKRAALACFGVSAVAGTVLSALSDPRLLIVGALSIAAAWFYTGGSKPYGYSGFGEPAVFIFFGLVATVGTFYAQTGTVSTAVVASGSAIGLLSVALLVANNLRDLSTDASSGKRTMAVRLGDHNTRVLYALSTLLPFVVVLFLVLLKPSVILALAALAFAVPPVRSVLGGATGHGLIEVLAATGKLQLGFGALLAVGWVV